MSSRIGNAVHIHNTVYSFDISYIIFDMFFSIYIYDIYI